MQRIGVDEGEDINASIMILFSATMAAILGAVGVQVGPPLPSGMEGLAIVMNPLWELYTVLVLAWGVGFVFRRFGVTRQFSVIVRLLAITRVWSLLGYLLMLFTPFGYALVLFSFVQFIYILGTTVPRGWGMILGVFLLGIVAALILTALLFLSMTFFIMFALLA